MPQTRLKTDGKFSLATCRSSVCIAAALTASTMGAIISPTSAQTAPVVQKDQEVTSGAYGWANTSNVKLHVRPSALTPYIAQVPHQTRMFVWGKFDGWYRVETSEKVFGWVYYKHLNVPEADKIHPLSHEKTRQACEKSHHLTMYGTPEMLRQYYAQYKAPGALRGLQLQNASLNSSGQTGSPQVLRFNNSSQSPVAVPAGNLPAISAEDILRARESYLRENGPDSDSAPVVVTPSSTYAAPTAQLQETVQEVVEPRVQNLVSLQQSPALAAAPQVAAEAEADAPQFETAPQIQTLVSFQKTPVNRGGSPRDRAAYNAAMGKSMANQALSYRGKPYIRGASSPSRGFDCSGLVYYLLRQRGYNPPRTAASLAKYGTAIPKSQLQPGDMVFFANTYKRGVSHIGVYIGNNKFVHAASSRTGVKVNSLGEAYYKKKWHSARRVPPK